MVLSVGTPAQAAGLAVLAWWVGKAGEIYRDAERWRRLRVVWSARADPPREVPEPAWLIVPVLVLAAVAPAIEVGSVGLRYAPMLGLFLLLAAWGRQRDARAVSNRALLVLVSLTVVSVSWALGPLSLRSAYPDLYDASLLGLAPLALARMRLVRLAACRLAAFAFLLALTLPDLYLRGNLVPLTYVVGVSAGREYLHLVSWAITIAAFEGGARLLHRVCGEEPARSGGV